MDSSYDEAVAEYVERAMLEGRKARLSSAKPKRVKHDHDKYAEESFQSQAEACKDNYELGKLILTHSWCMSNLAHAANITNAMVKKYNIILPLRSIER